MLKLKNCVVQSIFIEDELVMKMICSLFHCSFIIELTMRSCNLFLSIHLWMDILNHISRLPNRVADRTSLGVETPLHQRRTNSRTLEIIVYKKQ